MPGLIHYAFGQTTTVLVDPSDYSYAEWPGDPNATLGYGLGLRAVRTLSGGSAQEAEVSRQAVLYLSHVVAR